jgi:hypothetical protein
VPTTHVICACRHVQLLVGPYTVLPTNEMCPTVSKAGKPSTEQSGLLINRGVQIRSDQIRSDFGTKIYISDRIGLIKLFRSRIGSDFDIRNKMN